MDHLRASRSRLDIARRRDRFNECKSTKQALRGGQRVLINTDPYEGSEVSDTHTHTHTHNKVFTAADTHWSADLIISLCKSDRIHFLSEPTEASGEKLSALRLKKEMSCVQATHSHSWPAAALLLSLQAFMESVSRQNKKWSVSTARCSCRMKGGRGSFVRINISGLKPGV